MHISYIKTLTKRSTHRMTYLQFRRDISQCLVEPLLEERQVSPSVTPSVSAAALYQESKGCSLFGKKNKEERLHCL